MRVACAFVCLTLLLGFPTDVPAQGAAKERVAVLEFRDHGAVGERDRDYLTDVVVRGAVREGLPSARYFVMTRESLVTLLRSSTPDVRI